MMLVNIKGCCLIEGRGDVELEAEVVEGRAGKDVFN